MRNGKNSEVQAEVQAELIVGEQSSTVFSFPNALEAPLPSQMLSSPVRPAPRILAPAFAWGFAVSAVFAPMLLIVSASAISPDAIERGRILVEGLESAVFALVAALIVRVLYAFAIASDSTHRIRRSSSANRTASA